VTSILTDLTMHHLPNRQMVKESVKTVTVTPRLFLFDRAQSYRTLAADQANWKLGIARHHVKSIFRHLSTSRQIRRQPSCNIWNDRHRFKNPRYRIETGTSFAPITKFATKVFSTLFLISTGPARPNPKNFFSILAANQNDDVRGYTELFGYRKKRGPPVWTEMSREAVLTIPSEQQQSSERGSEPCPR